MNEPIVRYSAPGRYDVAKCGTICKVVGDNGVYELFVQLSEDESVANWQRMGSLLEKAFKSFLERQEFIRLCLALSSAKGDGAELYEALARILISNDL